MPGYRFRHAGNKDDWGKGRGQADRMTVSDAQRILQDQGATADELRDAELLKSRWRTIAKKLHPDLPGAPADASKQLAKVNSAYQLLRDRGFSGSGSAPAGPGTRRKPPGSNLRPVGDPRVFYEALRRSKGVVPLSRADVLQWARRVQAAGLRRMQWMASSTAAPYGNEQRQGFWDSVTKTRTMKDDGIQFDAETILMKLAATIGMAQGAAGVDLEWWESVMWAQLGDGEAGLIWVVPTGIRVGPLGSSYKTEWGSFRFLPALKSTKRTGDVVGGKNLWHPATASRHLRKGGLHVVNRALPLPGTSMVVQAWSTHKDNPRRILVMQTQLKGTGFDEYGTPYGSVTEWALNNAIAQVKAWQRPAPHGEAGTWTRERAEAWLQADGWVQKGDSSDHHKNAKKQWTWPGQWFPILETSSYGLGEEYNRGKIKWADLTEAKLRKFIKKTT